MKYNFTVRRGFYNAFELEFSNDDGFALDTKDIVFDVDGIDVSITKNGNKLKIEFSSSSTKELKDNEFKYILYVKKGNERELLLEGFVYLKDIYGH